MPIRTADSFSRHSSSFRTPWISGGSLRRFEWTKVDLPINDLPSELSGLRIVHITDTHLKPRWSAGHSLVMDRLADDPPDLVLITGDFVDDIVDSRAALVNLARFVGGLRARLGIFAITGNHDGDLIGPRLEGLGVHYLNERSLQLTIAAGHQSREVELIGLPGVRRRNFSPLFIESIPPTRPGVPRIVLSHFPDQITQIQKLNADLMLAGHTHGGQICLPSGLAMLTHDQLPKKMAEGLWKVGRTNLIVSRGMGWTRWPVRVFCPAEVLEITLVNRESSLPLPS